MAIKLLLLLSCVLLLANIECSRILGVVPTPSFSHQVIFRPIWRELHRRGHHLTILTTDPENDPALKNITEINLHEAYNFWHTDELSANSKYNKIDELKQIFKMMDDVVKFELAHPQVQAVIKNESEHFDLVIVEYLFPSMAMFAERFRAPYVGVTSMDAPFFAHDIMGNPAHPVLYPEFQLPFIVPLNFIERVLSVVIRIAMEIFGQLVFQNQNDLVETYFGTGYPPMLSVIQNISMLFLNTNPAFHMIRPLVPTTIQIGGGSHLTPPKPLPKDLKDYLDAAEKHGAIYFSLGTNVKSSSVDANLKQIFVEVLGRLPYTVLWKFDDDIANLPKNIKIIKWGPQQDIMRHRNIKLFITQGGLQSTEEALHSHVPMVVIPFFADQVSNSKIIKSKEFGVVLDKDTLSAKIFEETINDVIRNPMYKDTVKKFAKILVDQPMSGTEKAVWWIEYVIRHKGAGHLKSSASTLPLYQYLCLDVIGFLLLITVFAPFVLYKSIKFIVTKMFSKKAKTE